MRDMVRAEVRDALGPLRDRLEELERSMLETIVRLASSSSTAPATSSLPKLDAAPEPHGAGSGLLSWARAGDRKGRLIVLVFGGGVAVGMATLFALLASCR